MRLKTLLASLIITLATIAGASAPALAAAPAAAPSTSCVPGPMYWPTTGQVTTSNGSQRSISLTFTPTQAQLNALVCLGGYLKIDFVVQNAGVSGTAYTLSTNVGSVKEVPLVSSSFIPGATYIAATALQAGSTYYVTTAWTGGNATPTFSANWVGAHYASSMFEKNICKNGTNTGGMAWCVFATSQYPNGSYTHSLTNGSVALDGTTYTIH
jgi:hypothetical protein